MTTGKVKWFHSKKGYGFITQDGEEKDIFVHYTAIKAVEGGFKTLHQNDKVEFTVQQGNKGPEAHDVTVTEAAPRPPRRSRKMEGAEGEVQAAEDKQE